MSCFVQSTSMPSGGGAPELLEEWDKPTITGSSSSNYCVLTDCKTILTNAYNQGKTWAFLIMNKLEVGSVTRFSTLATTTIYLPSVMSYITQYVSADICGNYSLYFQPSVADDASLYGIMYFVGSATEYTISLWAY